MVFIKKKKKQEEENLLKGLLLNSMPITRGKSK
jgi:hypothetical protein